MSVSPFDRLATGLRDLVQREHRNSGSGAERFKVIHTTPLTLEEVGGSVVLEEGDPDFTIGAWLRQFRLQYTLAIGDEVWCLREGTEWHVVDVTDPGGQARI